MLFWPKLLLLDQKFLERDKKAEFVVFSFSVSLPATFRFLELELISHIVEPSCLEG